MIRWLMAQELNMEAGSVFLPFLTADRIQVIEREIVQPQALTPAFNLRPAFAFEL